MNLDETRLNCSSACTVLFQLIEGTNSHQKECLGIMTPDYYYYLNQSGTYKVDGTNDNKDFQETMVRFKNTHNCFFFNHITTFKVYLAFSRKPCR